MGVSLGAGCRIAKSWCIIIQPYDGIGSMKPIEIKTTNNELVTKVYDLMKSSQQTQK